MKTACAWLLTVALTAFTGHACARLQLTLEGQALQPAERAAREIPAREAL